MTPDQILEQIRQLEWYEVAKVAFIDDFILIQKIWPVYILIIIVSIILAVIINKGE